MLSALSCRFRGARGFRRAHRCLHPGCDLDSLGRFPLAGTYSGRDAVVSGFHSTAARLFSADHAGVLELIQLIGDGPIVAAEFTFRTMTALDRPYHNHYVEVFEIDGSQIKHVREYMDTQHLRKGVFLMEANETSTQSDESKNARHCVEVAVIGGGPGGLSAAAMIKEAGMQPVIFERAQHVGSSWRGHYDRLHLHTVRWMSNLPGLPFPRKEGKWVSRDGVVKHLERYAVHYGLEVRTGIDVARIDPTVGGWRLQTSEGPIDAGQSSWPPATTRSRWSQPGRVLTRTKAN